MKKMKIKVLCPKCRTPVIKRMITTRGDHVYDCYNCNDQIADSAVIFEKVRLNDKVRR